MSFLELVLALAIDVHQLGLEDQNGVTWNWPHTACTVSILWLNGKLPLVSNAHVLQALVPSFDDLAFSEGEAKRLVAVVGSVKLGAVFEGAAVVHVDLVACMRVSMCGIGASVAEPRTWLGLSGALVSLQDVDVKRLVKRRCARKEKAEGRSDSCKFHCCSGYVCSIVVEEVELGECAV